MKESRNYTKQKVNLLFALLSKRFFHINRYFVYGFFFKFLYEK